MNTRPTLKHFLTAFLITNTSIVQSMEKVATTNAIVSSADNEFAKKLIEISKNHMIFPRENALAIKKIIEEIENNALGTVKHYDIQTIAEYYIFAKNATLPKYAIRLIPSTDSNGEGLKLFYATVYEDTDAEKAWRTNFLQEEPAQQVISSSTPPTDAPTPQPGVLNLFMSFKKTVSKSP